MTEVSKKCVIKYTAVSAAVLVILLVFFGLSYAGTLVRQKQSIRTAAAVCTAAPALQNHQVKITGSYTGTPLGIAFRHVLTAVYDEKDALVFLQPLAGRYGLYTGVFLYDASSGCIFCGLTGKGAYSDAAYCGISPASLAVTRKKIENLMTGKTP